MKQTNSDAPRSTHRATRDVLPYRPRAALADWRGARGVIRATGARLARESSSRDHRGGGALGFFFLFFLLPHAHV